MTSRAWQEHKIAGERYDEIRVVTIFPIDKGFLLTMRGHMRDGKTTFGHAETTFFATFEQAQDIADTLLKHIRSKTNQLDSPGSDDPVP